MVRAVALDWGHTVMDERRDAALPLDARPIHLMPGAREALPQLTLPLALWANTRAATSAEVRAWLERAGIAAQFRWVITSREAGARKPDARFFRYALDVMAVTAEEVIFVGNQLNTDIAGAGALGIRTVWLSGAAYRSEEDGWCAAQPTHAIETLLELPKLLITYGIDPAATESSS